tara:strand:- start:211 stop:864 length:654 start_codon:yes stop_codon:yes gene_type:complete
MNWQQIVEKYGHTLERECDYRLARPQAHNPTGGPHFYEKFHCAPDGYGTEFEVCNFLNAIIKLMKFENILETGCEQAHGTVALAEACQFNGFGKVTTVDSCRVAAVKGPKKVQECGLQDYVDHVVAFTQDFCRAYEGPPFDFVFFDCGWESRVECYEILKERGKLGKAVSFHDTDRWSDEQYCVDYWRKVQDIAEKDGIGGVYNEMSRGFTFIQLQK